MSEVAEKQIKIENTSLVDEARAEVEVKKEENAEVSVKKEKTEELNTVRIEWEKLTFDEILQQKIKLTDQQEHPIFSRGPKYSDEFWPIHCHICRFGTIFTEKELRDHLQQRRHRIREHGRLIDATAYLQPFYQSFSKKIENETPIKIFAGEFITELTGEFADRAMKKGDFEAKLPSEDKIKLLEDDPMYEYNKKMPLIGLSYVYKMVGHKGVSCFCLLCNDKIKSDAYAHVTGVEHQLKYIKRHFPNTYQKVNSQLQTARNIDLQFCITNIFRKLYRKIENMKGFQKMPMVDDQDFYANRKKYTLKTRFDEHYDEDTVIITDKEVDVLIRKSQSGGQFIKPDLISLSNPRLGFRMGKAGQGSGGNEQRWQKYFAAVEKKVSELNQAYRRYDRYPKSHPKYEEELKKYKEHKNDKNASLSFSTFWTRRLRVLYEQELAKYKSESKKGLGMRADQRSPSPPARNNNQPDPTQLRDMLAMGLQQISQQRQFEMMQQQQQQLLQQQQLQQQQHMQRQQQLQQQQQRYQMEQQAQQQQIKEEPLGVLSVLRLYTALEGVLGSQGPQAINLLTRAVLAEKNNQNPNDLMSENEYYMHFLAVKEILKGQLQGNFLQGNIVRGVQKAIKDTETLIDMYDDYCRRNNKRFKTEVTSSIKGNNNYKQEPSNNYDGHNNRKSSGNQNYNQLQGSFSSSSSGNNFAGQNNRNNSVGNNKNYSNFSSSSSSNNYQGQSSRNAGGNNNYNQLQGMGNFPSSASSTKYRSFDNNDGGWNNSNNSSNLGNTFNSFQSGKNGMSNSNRGEDNFYSDNFNM